MDPFTIAVTDLVVAAGAPNGSPENTHRELMQMLRAARDVETELLDDALRRLGDVIHVADVPKASLVAIGCGAMVEGGGNPDLAVGAILERLPEVLERALGFARACEKTAQADPTFSEDDESKTTETALGQFDVGRYVTLYGEQVAALDPDGANAWMATEQMGMGAIAMLSRSPAARGAAKGIPLLTSLAGDLAAYHGRAIFLHKLLQVLDDEVLLVIHVPQSRGYRVKIRGIADNFQLHVLLADALIGDTSKGLLDGDRPDPRVVAAAEDQPVAPDTPPATGAFNLVNWTGLRPDGTLAEGHADHTHWIWNEGVPADVQPFDGLRVVLLTKPSYSRNWNPGRIFFGMPGELEIVEILQPAAVRHWIERIVKGPTPE